MFGSLDACVKTVQTLADDLQLIYQHILRTQIAGVKELRILQVGGVFRLMRI